jgi:hypothetical protein
MVNARVTFNFIRFKTFFKRLCELPSSDSKIFRTFYNRTLGRLFLGICLLSIGGLVAFQAHKGSGEEFLSNWMTENTPSEQLISKLLLTQEYQRIDDPKKIHACLRSLKISWDEQGSFWSSQDGRWLVAFPGPKEQNRVLIFSRDRLGKPDQSTLWIRIEKRGWPALQNLLTRNETKVDKSPPSKPNKFYKDAYRDPRQIQY